MSRTRVRRRRTTVLVTAGLVLGVWAGPVARALGDSSEEPVPVSSRTYVLRVGDTLWSIAERVAPGRDPRPVVDAIEAMNALEAGALVPGRTISVPSFEERPGSD